jgi:hypothetical protein
MTATKSGYSYPRVATIRIDIHTARENPTNTPRTIPTPVPISPYVAPFHESLTELSRPTTQENKGSRHNPQCVADRSMGPYLASLPSQPMKKWGQSQASINDRLLGLLGSYHQYAIGMFKTCSRGPTHRSLTDAGGGYNLGGAGFPHTTPRPSQLPVSLFHLRAPPGLQFNQVLSTKLIC